MSGLKSVTLYDGKTISYTYDDACRLTAVKTPFGTTKYEYDLMDRLVRAVAHDGTVTLYEYDVNGNRTAVRYANGIVMSYEYDEVNRLVREKVLDKNGSTVVEYKYTLGAAGGRLKVVETGRTVEYEYDELYRLVKETVTDHSGTTVTEYTYDRNSNRLTKTVDGVVTKYVYNELNQLVSETGITYEYDLNGNLVKKTEGDQTTVYTYNAQNRLIRVTVQSGMQVDIEEYRYDYAGNRIAKIGELSATYYLVDTNGALSQVLAEYDENGSLTTYYTCSAELISQERNGVKSYYIYDGHDSVRMLTDEDGTVTDLYTYDAFGNLTEKLGDTENSYLYCGEQFDAFTGLYYLRARYMNPSTGTFITMDEYAGSNFEPVSLHKYLYANANPVNNSDPSGYFTHADNQAAMAGMAILAATVVSTYGLKILESLNITISSSSIFDDGDILGWSEGIASGAVTSPNIVGDIRDRSEEDADVDVDVLTKNRRRNDEHTYYHATSKAIASQLILFATFGGTALLEGSPWESGHVFVWKQKPDKKALKLCGAKSAEVIIAFESNAHFENDPAFSTYPNPDLSTKDLIYIRKFQPLRSVFPGPISIKNIRIVE